MTSVILPSESSGVSIYDTPADLPSALSVPEGTVASVISDGTIRQAQGAVWEVVGSTTVIVGVGDTATINNSLTLDILTSDLILSPDAADAGSQLVALNAQANGLRAQIGNSLIRGLFSILDSNSIDLAYDNSTGEFTGALKLSAVAADANNFLASLSIQADGLRAQIPNASIQGLFSVLDSTSINFSYNSGTGVFSGEVIFSGSAADAGFIQTQVGDDGTGVRAQTSIALIQGLFGVTDTNSIDFSYLSGVISGSVRLSAEAADANNQLVTLSIETDGIKAQIADSLIRGLFSIIDGDSINLSYNSGTGEFTGDLILSPAAANAGNILASVSVESDGLKVQVSIDLIYGLFSATAPLAYDDATGVFSSTAATEALAGHVTTAAQNFGGDKAFVDNILKVNNSTNTSAVSGIRARDAFAQPTNLQSAVFTFLTNTGLNTSPHFELYAGNNMALISAPYGSTEINWLSDPGNIALLADAGTGFFISKSANSSALTIKNRSGGTLSVGVLPVHGTVTATAWA